MTQKQRILAQLKAAGGLGIRSDVCIRDFMPRAAARIQELKEDGWDISSEREGKYCRWTLNVGVESDDTNVFQPSGQEHPGNRGITLDSGVEHSASHTSPRPGASDAPPESFEGRRSASSGLITVNAASRVNDRSEPASSKNPYEFDVWVDEAA